MRTLLRWTGRALLALCLLILLLLGLLLGLVGTDRGFAFAVERAQGFVPGLRIEALAGNVLSGPDSRRIDYRSDALDVRVDGLDTEWRFGCLTERRFCIDRIHADEIIVTLQENTAAPPPEAPPRDGPIELPDIALPIDVSIDEITVDTVRIRLPGDAPEQVINDIRLSARTDDGTLTLDELRAAYRNVRARVHGTVTPSDGWPLDLDIAVDATDVLDSHDFTVDAALDGSAEALRFDVGLDGAASARLDGNASPLDPDLPLQARLRADALGWPLDTRALASAGNVRLDIAGTMDDYRIDLDTTVTGESVPETGILLRAQANPARVNVPILEIDTLDGDVFVNAYVDLGEQIAWRATLAAAGLRPDVATEAISGRIDARLASSGRLDGNRWSLQLEQLTVDGELQAQPLVLDARASKSLDDVWTVERLVLENGENVLNARGYVTDRWNLTADARFVALDNFLPELGGGFTLDLTAAGALAEPDVSLDLQADAISYAEYAISGLALTADVNRLAIADSRLALGIEAIDAAGQAIDNVSLEADGSRESHRLTLFADGPDATSVDLALSGSLAENLAWDGRLDAAELEVPAHMIALREPTGMRWNPDAAVFGVDAHCWITGDASLCLENAVEAAPTGEARLTLDGYSLERLEPFLPSTTSLAGGVSLEADARWGNTATDRFDADVALALDDGRITVFDEDGNPVDFRYDRLAVDADLAPDAVEAQIDLRSELIGNADIRFALDPADEAMPIEGRLDLSGVDIGFVQAFVPDLDTVAGVIDARGDLSGRLSDPRFNGEIVLGGLRVDGEILPLSIEAGEITTAVRGRRAFIEGALDTSGDGTIAIDGSANWQQVENWRADVSIVGDNLDIRQDPLVESQIEPDLRISLRPGRLRVGGRVDIPMARIDVQELPQGAAGLSDDVVIIEDIEEDDGTAGAAGPPLDLDVGIEISIGDDVDLAAYGLEASVRGDMRVGIDGDDPPQLGGELNVYDGIYKQYGQNLQADGEILFVGPVDLTRLDIRAVREIDNEDRVAGLHITGTVESPEIDLFTEPADKSEEAILSYIVLGRDIGEASDQEANLLASAAIALSARGGRAVGSSIADSLGIEEFGLETAGSGDDTEVIVSGRINDRLLLRYGQSVFDPQQTLYLRYDITRDLYLEAAQGLERAVDLFYSFSF